MNETPSTMQFVKDTRVVIDDQALAAAGSATGSSTSLIEYNSAGFCLVIGEPDTALDYVELLAPLKVTVATTAASSFEKKLTASGTAVYHCPELTLTGHLGQFEATALGHDGNPIQLGISALTESGYFDVVLDLSKEPSISASLPPFGYYRVTDDRSRQRCLDELPALVGEFEKPKYFNHNASICAHERSQIKGCTRCQDVCLTGAINSSGESISVDPFLCQGCGHCATVCPSGAMTYAYPKPADAIDKARELLDAHKQQHGGKPATALVLYTEQDVADETATEDSGDADLLQMLGDHVLPLAVEEVGAYGLDFWSSMVASGVQRLVLLEGSDESGSQTRGVDAAGIGKANDAITEQIEIADRIFQGLQLPKAMVQLVQRADRGAVLAACQPDPTAAEWLSGMTPARYTTHNDKRQTLRFAVDHLAAHTEPVLPVVALADGSPFGRLEIDKDACTLCLACVSTCPAGALLDGQNLPQLKFIESNCVQCGICASACPEDALQLNPQFRYDSMEARTADILNEEEPFNCLRCHKPFATRKMIDNMSAKLSGHWMFEDESRLRRLKMCEDCRVKDMFEESAGGIDVHKQT